MERLSNLNDNYVCEQRGDVVLRYHVMPTQYVNNPDQCSECYRLTALCGRLDGTGLDSRIEARSISTLWRSGRPVDLRMYARSTDVLVVAVLDLSAF